MLLNVYKVSVLLVGYLFLLQPVYAVGVNYLNDADRGSGKPYSEAVQVGDMLYLSGVVGVKPGQKKPVEGGIQAETRQVMENIKTVLERHGSSMDEVVKCTVMLANIEDYNAVNQIYVHYFRQHKPARSAFATSGLAFGAALEMECWAAVNQ